MVKNMTQLAIGIVRRGDEVLLVQEDLVDDGSLGWSLPGGGVEVGETFLEAVVREIREECGLIAYPAAKAAFIVNSTSEKYPSAVAIAFEMSVKEQTDPCPEDSEIRSAEFVPLKEAIRRVELIKSDVQRDPILSYLKGETPPGCVWAYRIEDGTEECQARP